MTYNWATQHFFQDSITAAVFTANSAYTRTTAQDTDNTGDRVLKRASENGSPKTEAGDYTMMTLANDGSHVQAQSHIVLYLSDTANEDPTGGTESGGGGGGGPGGMAIRVKKSNANATIKKSGTTAKSTSTSSAKFKPGSLRSKRYD